MLKKLFPLSAEQDREFDIRRARAKLPFARIMLFFGVSMLLAFSLREWMHDPWSSRVAVRGGGALLLIAQYLVFRWLGVERHFRPMSTLIYGTYFIILLLSLASSEHGFTLGLSGLVLTLISSAVILNRVRDCVWNFPLVALAIAVIYIKGNGQHVLLNDAAYLLIALAMSLLYAYVIEQTNRQAYLSEIQLEKEARLDYLTGLPNRRHLESVAQREMQRSQRFARPLSVMLVDIDHFKSVNDTHGHAAGDAVIQQTGLLLVQALRNVDIVGRHGGEEFAVLLPETSEDDAFALAQRLRARVAEHNFELSRGHAHLTVSIGVTTYRGQTQDWSALLHLADQAMYQAKHSGRNSVASSGLQPPPGSQHPPEAVHNTGLQMLA